MTIDAKIRSIIENFGHIKIDDMMREVLSINTASYYRAKDSIGINGDFITAPEISQLFGEVIGFWVIKKWQELGSPKNISLIELGPGQGFLMHNLVRVAKLVPEFEQSVQIYLLEINENFIKKQKENISFATNKIQWINDINQLPLQSSIIISNEFFDALPIKQYIKLQQRWYEVVLACDPVTNNLIYDKIELHSLLRSQFDHDYKNAEDGAVIEESITALNIIRKISDHLIKYKGACLTIDYGYDVNPTLRNRRQFTSTLQAIKNHQYHPIIDSLGEADISAHVDFYALKNAVIQHGIKDITISNQADFLIQEGIIIRQQLLKAKNSAQEAIILDKQLHRLINKEQMGELFKVMQFDSLKN